MQTPRPGVDAPLASFARLMYRRRRSVVAAWIAVLVAVSALAGAYGGEHRADYTMPGSDSAAALDLLADRFPERSGDTADLVLAAPGGIGGPAAEQVERVRQRIAAVDHVSAVDVVAVSADGTVAQAAIRLDAKVEHVPLAVAEELIAIAEEADSAELTVDVGGALIQNAEGNEAGSEQIGMMAALVILLVVFGSVLAAGLPILVALFGIGVTLASVQLLNRLFMIPEWAPTIVTMIGIGVGIDYALFIVTRYRAALADGEEPEAAVVTALTTAGRAVLFAGGTVVISLLGLATMRLEYLYGTAAATVTGVFVVLAASMTLLPAILGFAGRGIDRLRVPFVRGDRGDAGLWARWSRVVQRRPIVTGTVAFLLVAGLAAPFTGLRFGYPDAGTGPEHLTSRRAYDLVAGAFGPGANGPLVVAVDLAAGGDLARLTEAIAADPGVAAVLPPEVNAAGDAATVVVLPATGPQDERTNDLVHRLRDDVVPAVEAATGASVHVGGLTASFLDESELMASRLPVFIAAVISLSFVLLLVVFRSVLVAVKAALLNVLSIGAAYGVMAVALDGGWLGQAIGITESTPLPAWAPMMMFALLFGLSMDYEVFLLSRIREEYLRTGDNASAVADGLARTGRVITAAAAIMVTVFGAFVLGDQVLVKVIGLGLAVAILVDATVVRMVLVPSTMELLGDRNWWMPAWLDRLLPRIDVEGGALDLDAELEALTDQPDLAAVPGR